MSGARELQILIGALEEHRSTFGNAQYAFILNSAPRESLHDFAKSIGPILRESYIRIEELFYDALYWHDSTDEVKEHLDILIWAQVRTIYRLEDVEGYDAPEIIAQKVRAKQTEFLATLDKRVAAHPSHKTQTVDTALLEHVRAWAIVGFTLWIS